MHRGTHSASYAARRVPAFSRSLGSVHLRARRGFLRLHGVFPVEGYLVEAGVLDGPRVCHLWLLRFQAQQTQKKMTRTLTTTPAEDGFWMPAEFEPHAGCWMLWP